MNASNTLTITKFGNHFVIEPMIDEFDFEGDVMDELCPVELVSLEEAGLEESHFHPLFGLSPRNYDSTSGCIADYCAWFYDDEGCSEQ